MGEPAAHNVADVCIGAQCPSYQETEEMLVAPFLQRGCSRALPNPPEELRNHQLLVGFTSEGSPCVARIDSRLRELRTKDAAIRSFARHISPSRWSDRQVSSHFVPLNTLFSAKRLEDFKVCLWVSRKGITGANIDNSVEHKVEQDALDRLGQHGLDMNEKGDHPLDSIVAFRDHGSDQSRASRVVSCETQWDVSSDDDPDSFQNSFFAFPAFGLTGKSLDDSI
ncbi:hypothetical protein CEP54_004480 [Fusarium duplospermum]|uniref:Uncharacterized protein n=1 Tax=Fusarium duplospermum TaxID=1325734 RepID=A0A428QI22_9HYPO|nr:hypothetical protein CEP54_004480 [Fusarium duplospermum]